MEVWRELTTVGLAAAPRAVSEYTEALGPPFSSSVESSRWVSSGLMIRFRFCLLTYGIIFLWM
eukprot:343055-Prymnesium_polylepis.1